VTTAETAPQKEKKAGDLALNKLAAGAGAAATSAVLGSFFGDMGTVTGAAVGSVFSAIVTAAYQHSLDKTRDTVKAKIKLPGGRTVAVEGKTEVPAPPVAPGGETGQARVYVTPGDRPTEVMSAVPATAAAPAGPPRSRRRLLLVTGFAVIVFVGGMLAITGIELVKGSRIGNTSASTSTQRGGTSLGTVLGGSGAASTQSSNEESTTSAEETEDPSDEESSPATASDNKDSGPTTERATPFGSDADEPAPTTSRSPRATPTPTPTPDADSDTGGGADANAQSGGGADTPAQQ